MESEFDTAKYAKVQCIREPGPWAVRMGREQFGATGPMVFDEVAIIPRDEAFQRMLRARHVIEIKG